MISLQQSMLDKHGITQHDLYGALQEAVVSQLHRDFQMKAMGLADYIDLLQETEQATSVGSMLGQYQEHVVDAAVVDLEGAFDEGVLLGLQLAARRQEREEEESVAEGMQVAADARREKVDDMAEEQTKEQRMLMLEPCTPTEEDFLEYVALRHGVTSATYKWAKEWGFNHIDWVHATELGDTLRKFYDAFVETFMQGLD